MSLASALVASSDSYASSIPVSSLQHSVQHPERRGTPELNFTVVVIISLLTVAFALSGCLHLVARCFARRQNADAESVVTIGSLHGPLQQLFHVHDTGVDQATIDALPVFVYKALKGVEEGNDCAVCLSEFQPNDRLRFLPHCSHAFHVECIGTWLFSHSTCPLCRRSILSEGFLTPQIFGMVGDSYRSGSDMIVDGEDRIERVDAWISPGSEESLGRYAIGSWEGASPRDAPPQLSSHKRARSEKLAGDHTDDIEKGKFVSVQLGRFKNSGGGEASSRQRRSYSMGSYEYVLNANDLQVPLSPLRYSGIYFKRHCHRPALSECIPGFRYEEFKTGDDLAGVKRKQMSRELDESSWVNLTLDDKIEVKETSSNVPVFLDSMKERLLNRMWPLSAPKSPVSETAAPRGRTFSFRLPRPERKVKPSENRRSLSETTGLDSVVCVSMPSTITGSSLHGSSSDTESSNGRLPSFRKWARNWLRS